MIVDGFSIFNLFRIFNVEIISLLDDILVVVGGLVFKGCLDNVCIGGLLFLFVNYYNKILNVSYVIFLKFYFNVIIIGL